MFNTFYGAEREFWANATSFIIVTFATKTLLSSKTEFYGRGFLKLIVSFSHLRCSLVLKIDYYTCSTSLLCSRIDSEYGIFFWNFSVLGNEENTAPDHASAPCLNVATKTTKNKIIIIYYFIWTLVESFCNSYSILISLRSMVKSAKCICFFWTLVESFYNSYSILISLRSMVEKCKIHLQS